MRRAPLLLTALCIACAAPTPRVEAPPAQPPPAPDLTPRGPEPLRFAPGTFDWQPAGVPVVVHTIRESWAQQPERGDLGFEWPNPVALTVEIDALDRLQLPTGTPLWIAADLEELRFGGALHFYELRSSWRDAAAGWRLSLGWRPEPDVIMHTNHRALFTFFIRSSSFTSIIRDCDGDIVRGPPRLDPRWSPLSERCRGRCALNLLVWAPQRGTLHTAPGAGRVMGHHRFGDGDERRCTD